MYRNVYYDNKSSTMVLFTWDKDGKRVTKKTNFTPYFYTETAQKTGVYSIFGNKLKKHNFDSYFNRSQAIKTSGVTRVYNNLPPEQQFLLDRYWKVNKHEKFSKYDLSIFYLDIEVYSPNEFPEQYEAKHPINVVTIYNSLKNEFRVFCLKKKFDPRNLNEENINRLKKITKDCKIRPSTHSNEIELLNAILNYWKVDHPDILTGWNLHFDIPYLINRMMKLLSPKKYMGLSPIGKVRDTIRKIYGKSEMDYVIEGVTVLDYMDLHAKFDFKPVPNRQLDTIAEIELDIGKVKHESSNLAALSDENWDLFVFYNIEDVNVIRLLEKKLNFIRVGRLLSYMGLTPFSKCMDTLPIVTGYCAVNAYEEGKVIPTFIKEDVEWRKYEGAFVKEPVYKYCEQIVSYDLNSLYPMTMITLNTSPETKFGKIHDQDDKEVTFEDNSGKVTIVERHKFDDFVKKNRLARSKTGVLFSQGKMGIFPKLAEEVYNKRLEYKSKIKENKKKIEDTDDKEEKEKYDFENKTFDVYQMSFKILINSLYGYSGNKYAPMSDIDIAESVTITCQNVIKESSNILNDIIKQVMECEDIVDYVTYVDTDSNYLILKQLLNHLNLPFYDSDGYVHPKVVKLCGIIEQKLNDRIKKWGENELNSTDCRFRFKMEAISDRGIFFEKKNYALHVLNDEGFKVEDEDKRWKYKGIRLVSASMPKALKPLVKDILHDMIMNNSKHRADELYNLAYEKFTNLSEDDIAQVKSLNKYDEYANNCNGWSTAKRMLAHYKGAYYHNIIINEMGLKHKYGDIKQGDKVKYLYVTPKNRYGVEVISYNGSYPKEFKDIFVVDKNKMFEKGVKDVVKQFYSALNWRIHSPNMQTKVDIMEKFLETS